jgi:hypothetical protein
MDLSIVADVTPSSLSADAQAMTQMNYGTMVERKALDIEAAQGAMLAQLVAQSTGVGQNLDARA